MNARTRWLRALREVVGASLNAWIDHRPGSKGAALAFYTLFAMTPILILAIAGAGVFLGADEARGEIIAQVEALVGRSGAQAIRALVADATDPATSVIATLVATVLLLVAAASVFVELKGSLDELWGVPPPAGRAVVEFLRTQLHSFGLVLVLACLLLASLLVSAAVSLLERHAGAFPGLSVGLVGLASSLVSFAAIACLFAVIFKSLPACPLAWRDAWVGACFTTGLFALGKYAIGVYLSHSSVASGFGAAGSLIALLLWVYYCAQVFFLGAEFTRQYALRFGSLRDPAGGE